MKARFILAFLLGLNGCALHLIAPTPDIRQVTSLPPSNEISYIAAVARVPLQTLGALVDAQKVPPIQRSEKAMVLDWTVEVKKSGPTSVRGQNGQLCFMLPFQGNGKVSAMGQTLQRNIGAWIDACAKPLLDNAGTLRLADPVVRVSLDRTEIGGPLRVMLDGLAARLEQVGAQEVANYLKTLTVPTTDVTGPLVKALQLPMNLPQNACLKLRPLSLQLGQPLAETDSLRMAVSVAAQPTVEQPCAPEPRDAGRRGVPIALSNDLQHPETKLVLPIGIGLDTLQAQMLAQLTALGKMPLGKKGQEDQGWIQVNGLRLDTAKGALLVRAQIVGEVKDKFLFIPITRELSGEFLLWGVPELTPTHVQLGQIQLDLQTDDSLASVGAMLKRSQIIEVVQERLKISRAEIDKQARQQLAALQQTVQVAGQNMPVRVDVKELTLDSVTAANGRLQVQVRFVGYVVVGETESR